MSTEVPDDPRSFLFSMDFVFFSCNLAAPRDPTELLGDLPLQRPVGNWPVYQDMHLTRAQFIFQPFNQGQEAFRWLRPDCTHHAVRIAAPGKPDLDKQQPQEFTGCQSLLPCGGLCGQLFYFKHYSPCQQNRSFPCHPASP
jgi:hypothetical protein